MIFEMLRWWYVTGWAEAARRIGTWMMAVERNFSLGLLVRTLFSPWRRIITPGGRSLEDKLHAALDNLVSRSIGFVIRLFVILAAGVSMLGAFAAGTLIALVWPFMPLLIIFFIYQGITA